MSDQETDSDVRRAIGKVGDLAFEHGVTVSSKTVWRVVYEDERHHLKRINWYADESEVDEELVRLRSNGCVVSVSEYHLSGKEGRLF